MILGCEGIVRHGDQLEGVLVWKKQKRDGRLKLGFNSGMSQGTEKRGYQKHLRMKERKKMTLSILCFINPYMKPKYWDLIVSTQGRSTRYTVATMSTRHRQTRSNSTMTCIRSNSNRLQVPQIYYITFNS